MVQFDEVQHWPEDDTGEDVADDGGHADELADKCKSGRGDDNEP